MTEGFYVRIANAISVLGGLADFRAYNSSQRSKIFFFITAFEDRYHNYFFETRKLPGILIRLLTSAILFYNNIKSNNKALRKSLGLH